MWHLRIITHPNTIRAAVPKAYSSAPSNAMLMMSRPVFNCPSVCRRTCPRSPLSTSVCCVSLNPISGGIPAYLIEEAGDAPVPSAPEITIKSALAFATPAAIVPTPLSATSFTLIVARGFTFFRSKISCAKSSIL